jgi:tetratricopeptide (TPR) repeat protein
MSAEKIAERYYRLGLAAAKQRDLCAALRYARFACLLDPRHEGAARLLEICGFELGENFDEEQEAALERVRALARQKNWKAAAKEAKRIARPGVRPLVIQGCLWALAKRYAPAADCFARALGKDRGNRFAAEALAELSRRRNFFWRFFCFSTVMR